jgi:hypothetical protein
VFVILACYFQISVVCSPASVRTVPHQCLGSCHATAYVTSVSYHSRPNFHTLCNDKIHQFDTASILCNALVLN